MRNALLILIFFPTISFSQQSNITVYDEWGNNVGTYQVQSNYAEQHSDDLRMAMSDYISYLKTRDKKEQEAQRFEILKARGAKVGISVSKWQVQDELGGVGVETIIAMRERELYRRKQAKIEAEEKAKRNAAINKAVKSDIMNAYDYASNITLKYKKELGIKKGSGYFKMPSMLFKNQGKGKYVRQDGNIQMIYDFTWPGERNKDFVAQLKSYKRLSNKKLKGGESWREVEISRETIYRNTGIAATVEWEDEYDRGIRAYYGAEDSNGIDYFVMIESRANKKEASREDVKKIFDFYKPLLEICIANSRVTVKKLMNKTVVLDSEKTKRESKRNDFE
jgi:hypothetical protein